MWQHRNRLGYAVLLLCFFWAKPFVRFGSEIWFVRGNREKALLLVPG